jgi:hypothetical protein
MSFFVAYLSTLLMAKMLVASNGGMRHDESTRMGETSVVF